MHFDGQYVGLRFDCEICENSNNSYLTTLLHSDSLAESSCFHTNGIQVREKDGSSNAEIPQTREDVFPQYCVCGQGIEGK